MKKIYEKYNKEDIINKFFWISLLLIMLFKSFYFGIQYFNYLDDYNTYGIFNRRNSDIWNNIILWYGLYTFRPFAFLCDAYITQWFWQYMHLVLFFYTILHFLTVYFFYKITEKVGIKFGVFGIIIASITPLLFEATYWIAASTRLVAGMFFSIISVYFLLFYIENNKNKIYLNLYIILNIFCIGFYEQIVVFNLVFTLIIIYLIKDKIKENFRLIFSIPIISTLLISIFYIVFAPYGKVKTRGEISIDLFHQLKKVTLYIANILLKINFNINIKGFFNAISITKNFFQILILLLVILYSIILFLYMLKDKVLINKNIKYSNYFNIIISMILIILPFSPFYILKQSYMYPRSVYPSILGISLFIDTIFNIKRYKYLYKIVSVIFIVPFFAANISQLHDIKLIQETDNKIMYNFLNEFEKLNESEKNIIVLFNTKKLYSEVSNKNLENITSSDWALIGKANADSKKFYFKKMIPIENNEILYQDNLKNNILFFGIDDKLNIYNLKLERNILFIKENHKIFGYLDKENNNLKFKKA